MMFALATLALLVLFATALAFDFDAACNKDVNQHCLYTPAERLLVGGRGSVRVYGNIPSKLIASKFDNIGRGTFVVGDLQNGSVSVRCQGSSDAEAFPFIFQNGDSLLLSKTYNTGRANAYFSDGVSRGKMAPGGYMRSQKYGVDVVVEC